MDVKGKLLSPSSINIAKLQRKRAVISYLNAKKRSLVSPAKTVKIDCGCVNCCSQGQAVVKNYRKLRKSCTPARVMYFYEGNWTDFQSEIAVLVKQAFQDGKTVVEVAIDGVSCLLDFLHMLLIDLKSGAQRSIAWIDIDGKCFFPEASESECPTFARVCAANEAFEGLGDDLIKLGDDERDFVDVRNKFLAGLITVATFTSVIEIYRISHRSAAGQSRLHAFQEQVDIINRKNGSDGNIQCAWHGTSRDGVCGIIKHGFGQDDTVYLGAANCSYTGAVYSAVDENGEQHIVLCRVILGNTKPVKHGSAQCDSCSGDFGTGVDDLTNPTRYIIWGTHMNRRILPEYVVSFRVSPQSNEYWSRMKFRQCARLRRETDSPFPFLRLINFLEKFLSPSSFSLLKKHYADFKESKISQGDLVRNLKMIAGNRLLITALIDPSIMAALIEPSMNEKMSPGPKN